MSINKSVTTGNRNGKLTSEELKRCVLSIIKRRRAEVLCGAGLGEDCASFAVGAGTGTAGLASSEREAEILVSSDPITSAEKDIGSLAVIINCNDISAGGGEPFALTLTLIMPTTGSAEEISAIVRDAEAEATRQNVEIIGGHTEFSDAVTRPIVSATVFGFAKKHRRATACEAGDVLIMSKSAGLEGSFLLAEKHKAKLTHAEYTEAVSYKNLLSVRKDCEIAVGAGAVSLHDVTEGGVMGAVAELSEGAGLVATIYKDKVPVTAVTKKLAEAEGLDPLTMLASGAVIITATVAGAEGIIIALAKAGITATVIGRLEKGRQAEGAGLGTPKVGAKC